MTWKIQLFRLNYGEREFAAVRSVLESGWLTMGPRTIDFEEAYARLLGEGSRCLAVANGTAALHMAVLAVGVRSGDEVIVPSLTFIADLNVVRMSGATPVLADIVSRSDWSMDPADIERRITPRTKAVMIVHYAGYACDMRAIGEICDRHHLALIEDCAHAPGAEYEGRKLGTFGAVSAWSFFSNKNVAVGEGGMLATRDAQLFDTCRNLRSHGMTVTSFDRIKGRAGTYDVLEAGLNYRIDEIRAALGLVQLERLAEANARREALTRHYFGRLDRLAGISVPFRRFERGTPSFHIMPVLLDEDVDRTDVVEALKADGIQTSIHYPAIQSFAAYRAEANATPVAQYVCGHELTLPLFPTMTCQDVDSVCDSLARAIGARRER